jgi:hypothetical protein
MHLLIRACRPRVAEIESASADGGYERTTLMNAIKDAPVAGSIVVNAPRKPAQPEREARLEVQYQKMRVHPPKHDPQRRSKSPQTLTVIRAAEIDAPEGVAPICWVLICTMPVSSLEDAVRMVGYYTRRWVIERLHFTLKSGCSNVERVQIDDVNALKNALALYYVAAWRVLHLTYLARTEPDQPAWVVLSINELEVLRAAANRPIDTIADVFREIGCLAGHEHYKNAKPPGVKRIWRGLKILETLTEGWQLALTAAKKVNQD